MTLTCPNCGNDRNFQVKTLQMHVVHLEDGRVEVSDESRPAVLEVLCDECESALNFEEFENPLTSRSCHNRRALRRAPFPGGLLQSFRFGFFKVVALPAHPFLCSARAGLGVAWNVYSTVSISLRCIVSPQTGHSFVSGMILVLVEKVFFLKLASAPRLDKRGSGSYR